VRLVDERLSSVSANAALRSAGRDSRSARAVVDQVAAVIILQHALDFERSADRPPGVVVNSDEGL
jgi:putative Holliday junction resolvase